MDDGWTKSGAAELDTKAARRLCCKTNAVRSMQFQSVQFGTGIRETVKLMVKW